MRLHALAQSLLLVTTLCLGGTLGCGGDTPTATDEDTGRASPRPGGGGGRPSPGGGGNADDTGSGGEPGTGDDAGEDPGTDPTVPPPVVDPVPGTDAGTPPPPPPDRCEALTVVLKPEAGAVANFMLVVDRSNSMNEDGRWNTMTTALREVTGSLETLVNFGLMLFPGPGADATFGGSPCDTGSVRVQPAERTALAISSALSARPAGGTPTALSLLAARDALVARDPTALNYVLLATDGGPGCNNSFSGSTCECIPGTTCTFNNLNCLDRERTLQAVRDLQGAGIRTFVVGIPGTAAVSDLLDQMAVAGGTDVGGRHFAVTDLGELVNTLRSATGSTVPCTYEFPEAPARPEDIVVTIDGEVIPRDPSGINGWNLERDRFLELYGAACGLIRDGQPHAIEASYDCSP